MPHAVPPADLMQRIALLPDATNPAARALALSEIRKALFQMRAEVEAFGYQNGITKQKLSPEPVQMQRRREVPPISEQQTVTVDGVVWTVAATLTTDGWATYAVQIGEPPKRGHNWYSLEDLPALQFHLDALLGAEFAAEVAA